MVEVEEPGVPSVLAVVVTHDPGRWFGTTLDAFAAQSHPDLRVVVVDTGRGDLDELTARVHAGLPDALVHGVANDGRRMGFGRAANLALGLVGDDDAGDVDFLLVCHDDVAPDADAVSAMVAAAGTWDADLVGPKLVAWDEPRRLLQLGLGVGRVGHPVAYVDPGDLDQGQHDEAREVFAVPGACTLVRAELFRRIGGFDDAITFLFDDISLCWRARVAGGRVVLAPQARVRHRQGLVERVPEATRRRLQARHRLRVVLTSYSRSRLVAVGPRLAAGTGLEVVRALGTAQPSRVAIAMEAWSWNLRQPRSLWRARRQVRRSRLVPDRDVVRAQLPGLARAPLSFRRRAADPDPDLGDGTGGRSSDGVARPRWTTGAAVLTVLVAGMLAMGSRHLVTRGVPVVGDLLPLGPPDDLLGDWWRGWREGGGWPDTTVPTLLGAVGGLGSLLFGHTELLRMLLTVGLLPLGVLGAFRLLRPSGSARAPAIAALAYAAVPVPYVALAHGRWAPLVIYAAAPWMLGSLAAASGTAPFGPTSASSAADARRRGLWVSVLRAGLVTALASLLVPVAPLLLVGMGAALAFGAVLGWAWRAAVRLLVAAIAGAGVAIVLQLPWSAQVLRSLRGSAAALVAGTWPGMQSVDGPVSPTALLRLASEPGSTTLTCGLLGAAALVLCVGRRWRLAWGVRAWTLALAAGATVWLVGETGGPAGSPTVTPDVVLVVAGAGLTLAIGVGVAAVERDVAGRSRRLGVRRLVTAAGLVALAVGAFPLVQRSFEGDWDMATGDYDYLLASHAGDGVRVGQARILWVGDPAVMPGHGWPVGGDAGDATYLTTRGAPRAEELLPGAPDPEVVAVGAVVEEAVAGETARVGEALAPAGVRYVIVPQRLAPSPFDTDVWAPSPGVVAALDGQLDLRRVDFDPAFVVYENQAASPVLHAVLAPLGQPGWPPDDAAAASTASSSSSSSDPSAPRTSTWRPLLLALQVCVWLAVLVVLARQRVGWRRDTRVARAAQPREAVHLILPDAPRDMADMLDADDIDELGDDLAPVGAGRDER